MNQQIKSPKIYDQKKTNETSRNITYVENKSLKQEVAEIITNFSNFYSNKKNVKKVKAGLTGLVDDLHVHAIALNKAKKKGLGNGLIMMLFPNAVKAVENANKKPNKAKRNR
jgi:hypothetical protein